VVYPRLRWTAFHESYVICERFRASSRYDSVACSGRVCALDDGRAAPARGVCRRGAAGAGAM